MGDTLGVSFGWDGSSRRLLDTGIRRGPSLSRVGVVPISPLEMTSMAM
jgi:hypothetical protein